MPEPIEIFLETPSSSGESEKSSLPPPQQPIQRKKKKLSKSSSSTLANTSSQIPRPNLINPRNETKLISSPGRKSNSLVPFEPLRKSFSQMDMKMSKNINSRFQHRNFLQNNLGSKTLVKPILQPVKVPNNRDAYPSKDDSFYYIVNEPDYGGHDAKFAGMKIFATIMLNSWRKRRDEVKRLNEEIERLEKRAIKVKNQVHVLSSVFRNEQKQNEKLHRQLRHSSQELQTLQSSVENLTTSLISAKADASFFEQQFHSKEQENECLNNIIVETNSQLFKSMTQVRNLQSSLSQEQRTVQQLENQKNELKNELAAKDSEWKKKEEILQVEMYQKDGEIAKAQSEIKILETLLQDLKEKEFQVRDLKKSDTELKKEIDVLKAEKKYLEAELEKCLGARFKQFWKNCLELNQNTATMLHVGIYYLLPAFPPPKSLNLPYSVSLEKVMSFVR